MVCCYSLLELCRGNSNPKSAPIYMPASDVRCRITSLPSTQQTRRPCLNCSARRTINFTRNFVLRSAPAAICESFTVLLAFIVIIIFFCQRLYLRNSLSGIALAFPLTKLWLSPTLAHLSFPCNLPRFKPHRRHTVKVGCFH